MYISNHAHVLTQTLKFHSPASPDPLNARLLRLLGFPKSPPPPKNPRSANVFMKFVVSCDMKRGPEFGQGLLFFFAVWHFRTYFVDRFPKAWHFVVINSWRPWPRRWSVERLR